MNFASRVPYSVGSLAVSGLKRPLISAQSVPGYHALSVMVTDSMATRSFGLPEAVPMASMAATTSRPLTTFPNREYWGGGSCRWDR